TSNSGRRPQVCTRKPIEGDNSATTICGTTIQAAITAGANVLDCRVIKLPSRGSIAALANWNINNTSANFISGPFFARATTVVVRLLLPLSSTPCANCGLISSARISAQDTIVGIVKSSVMRKTDRLVKK